MISILLMASMAAPPVGGALRMPILIQDGTKPINVDTGHAAPWVHDMDKDGKPDLLVGQFDGGKLRIYRNKGERNAPKFEGFEYFQAGGETATVPYG